MGLWVGGDAGSRDKPFLGNREHESWERPCGAAPAWPPTSSPVGASHGGVAVISLLTPPSALTEPQPHSQDSQTLTSLGHTEPFMSHDFRSQVFLPVSFFPSAQNS